jgi:Glyoxalase/Bleomycin resistance protein/Dioxygenase superfamily
MNRFHVHVSVADLQKSIGFYNQLFGVSPSVTKPDYAKWMLEDPRVNFAISQRAANAGLAPGVDHLGIQVESAGELTALTSRLREANMSLTDEGETTCCYAQSDKGWVHDPSGIAWESFYTHGEATSYGIDTAGAGAEAASACCAPKAQTIGLGMPSLKKPSARL